MSNIAAGIEFALQQARLSREKTAGIVPTLAEPTTVALGGMGGAIKEAAKVLLAADEEDVTVGDLQALMGEFQ